MLRTNFPCPSTLTSRAENLHHHLGPLARIALLGAMLACLPHSVGAQSDASQGSRQRGDTLSLSIESARELALRQNAELVVARYDIEIARGQLRQAGTIQSNPTFDVLASGKGGARPELGVGQTLEIAGQRGLRKRSARQELTRASLTTSNVARLTISDVERAFYELFTADRRAELAREVFALNERLSDVASRQLREGEVSKLDYNLAMIELGRSRARNIGAQRERASAELALRQLLVLDRATIIKPMVDSIHQHVTLDSSDPASERAFAVRGISVDSMISRAYRQRPDLLAGDAAVRRASSDITLARREALPNLGVRLASEGNQNGNGTVLRPGVGINLPLFNRNGGEVDSRRAALKQAEAARAAVAVRVRAEVESAVRAYVAASAEVEVLESTVLVPARENRQLLEAAYREGKVGLAVLLLIRNQVIDAEQEYWSAWLAERQALTALSAATGDSTPTIPPGQR